MPVRNLKTYWPMKVTNEEITFKTNMETDWACAEEKCKLEQEDSLNMDPRRKTYER